MEEIQSSYGDKSSTNRLIKQAAGAVTVIVLAFLLGIGSGYLTWGKADNADLTGEKGLAELYERVNPSVGYALPVSYGDLGPRLIESGVIDQEKFTAIYADSGRPLSRVQNDILDQGSDEQIVITVENAHFLLNLFWAVGLANKNPILTEGPIVQNSGGQIERFASSGGWTLAARPFSQIYASLDLIPLTAVQQQRVAEVAAMVYRPCCDNPTLFPDCNHGMAMLGLLELMASQGASMDQMLEAAKYVNAFWFPQQNVETALFLKVTQDISFEDAEPRLVTGADFASGSGFAVTHQRLQKGRLLPQVPNQGGSCAN